MTDPAGAPAAVAPTCYRHPDRETYVRCTRCDRPICPDCMVSASVGFQCPECVTAGNEGVRQARTQYGGALVAQPGLITRILIGINLAAFVVELLVGISVATTNYGLYPPSVADGQYYRLISAGFLHGSLFHIGFNMAALYFLGQPLEAMLGRWRFVLVYAMSLIGGSVASFYFSPYNQVGVGASGAIFGLMGAFVIVAVKQKLDLRPFGVLIAVNLAFGFLPNSNIDWRAHLGGLAVGAVMAAAIVFPPKEYRIPVLVATVLVVLVFLAVVTIVRIDQLQTMFPQLGH